MFEKTPTGKDAMRTALASGTILHTRFRPFSTNPGGGYVCAYRQDSTSPSGKILACSCSAQDMDELMAEGQTSRSLSPLSPTEML